MTFVKTAIAIILFCYFPSAATAQEVIMEVNVAGDTLTPKFGQNRVHFLHAFAGYGFIGGSMEEGAFVRSGNSLSYHFGIRYKRKLTQVFAIGVDAGFRRESFFIAQKTGKQVPDSLFHEKEKIRISNLGFAGFLRINYGKRGDYIGRFTDLCVYGDGIARMSHLTRDELPGGQRVRSSYTRLGIEESYQYGILLRLGFNKWILYGQYRLSDLFMEKAALPELPRLQGGIQLGFH